MSFCVCVQEKQDGQSSAFTYREGREQQGGKTGGGEGIKSKGTENRKEVRENVMGSDAQLPVSKQRCQG